jgi:hypothetical protein
MKRTSAAIVLLLTVLGASIAACGDGRAAIEPTSLTPTPATSSPAVTLAPSTGASTSPGVSASPGSSSTPAGSNPPAALPSAGPSPAKVTDAWIKADLLRRLSAAPELVGQRLRVAVKARVVYLIGRVESAKQKRVAEDIAVTEPFIKKVVSYVQVVADNGY